MPVVSGLAAGAPSISLLPRESTIDGSLLTVLEVKVFLIPISPNPESKFQDSI